LEKGHLRAFNWYPKTVKKEILNLKATFYRGQGDQSDLGMGAGLAARASEET